MVTLVNRLRQPISYNLSDGTSLHVGAKEKDIQLNTENFNSPEIRNAVAKGDLMVVKMD